MKKKNFENIVIFTGLTVFEQYCALYIMDNSSGY